MKKIIFLFLLFVSCVSVHIGPHNYNFVDENKFPNGYEVTYIFNTNKSIIYKNIDMKIDVLKINYESTKYRTLNKKRGL